MATAFDRDILGGLRILGWRLRGLGGHDARCGACGYPARSWLGTSCPECGAPEAAVVDPRRVRWWPLKTMAAIWAAWIAGLLVLGLLTGPHITERWGPKRMPSLTHVLTWYPRSDAYPTFQVILRSPRDLAWPWESPRPRAGTLEMQIDHWATSDGRRGKGGYPGTAHGGPRLLIDGNGRVRFIGFAYNKAPADPAIAAALQGQMYSSEVVRQWLRDVQGVDVPRQHAQEIHEVAQALLGQPLSEVESIAAAMSSGQLPYAHGFSDANGRPFAPRWARRVTWAGLGLLALAPAAVLLTLVTLGWGWTRFRPILA